MIVPSRGPSVTPTRALASAAAAAAWEASELNLFEVGLRRRSDDAEHCGGLDQRVPGEQAGEHSRLDRRYVVSEPPPI
jgi:hypothetical protein